MAFDVESARRDLPSARAATYMNAGTFGPMPLATDAVMRAHLDRARDTGRIGNAGFASWMKQMDDARVLFAKLLSASVDEISLQHATTDGCNVVVWGLPLGRGDEILTTTAEHPGLTAPLEEAARVKGVAVRYVEPRALATSITSKTKLVAFSHVLWTNGDVLDVRAISEMACKHGALTLVDGAQSAGAMAVSPRDLGCDFYTVSGQKWLCGPSGTGALWISPAALARLGTPWPWYLSKKRSAAGVEDWSGARRLDATTISMIALDGCISSLKWHAEQVEKGAFEFARMQADKLRTKLEGKVQLLAADRPSHLVSFEASGKASDVVAMLESKGVLVRSIPDVDCVRASVGFWCNDGDLDRLVDSLS